MVIEYICKKLSNWILKSTFSERFKHHKYRLYNFCIIDNFCQTNEGLESSHELSQNRKCPDLQNGSETPREWIHQSRNRVTSFLQKRGMRCKIPSCVSDKRLQKSRWQPTSRMRFVFHMYLFIYSPLCTYACGMWAGVHMSCCTRGSKKTIWGNSHLPTV